MDIGSWFGKTLRVNLSTETITEENIEDNTLISWLGGRGLGMRTIAEEVPAESNPLGQENKLIFTTGPLTGTGTPGANHFSVTTKSPLTGTILNSNSSGRWGIRLKKSGYDMLIIEGNAATPVYLNISPNNVSLHKGDALWGRRVSETNTMLRNQLGKDISISCIGPAGENQVKFATITNDGHHALGRGGIGAVMGAKKLKAITTQGEQQVTVVQPEKFRLILYEIDKCLKANPITSQGLPEFGTPVLINILNNLGVLPSHNFQHTGRLDTGSFSGETITETMSVINKGCYGCPVQCIKQLKTGAGITTGPTYESICALGPQCGIDHLDVIIHANQLCGELGLDAVSSGVTIGCAMELTEKRLLDIPLTFGDSIALLQAIKQIACREEYGNLLAEGSRHLAEQCGHKQYAMQVKGLELPAYDPRGLQGMGLGFATSNWGGCHLQAYMAGLEALGVPKMVDRFGTAGKAGLTINLQNISAAIDSLIACRLISLAVPEEYFARLLSAATGVNYQLQDLYSIGEAIWNMERLYNLRAGFDCTTDTLPARLLTEPLSDGASRNHVVNLHPMLAEYYRFRSWNEKGIPTQQKIQELGLEGLLC